MSDQLDLAISKAEEKLGAAPGASGPAGLDALDALIQLAARKSPNPAAQLEEMDVLDTTHVAELGLARRGAPPDRPPPRLNGDLAQEMRQKIAELNAHTGLDPATGPRDATMRAYVADQMPNLPENAEKSPGISVLWAEAQKGDARIQKAFHERLTELHQVRYFLNRAQPSPRETRAAFDDAFQDWTHGRLVMDATPEPIQRGFTGPAQQPPQFVDVPLTPTVQPNPERLFDIYARFLGTGKKAIETLSDADRAQYDGVDGENFFAYFDRKQQFYTSRLRYEQLTQQPWLREQPPVIRRDQLTGPHPAWGTHAQARYNAAPGLGFYAFNDSLSYVPFIERFKDEPNESGSTVPDRNDFRPDHLMSVSPFAEFLVRSGQEIQVQAAAEPQLPSLAGSYLTSFINVVPALFSGAFEIAGKGVALSGGAISDAYDYYGGALAGKEPTDPRSHETKEFLGNVIRGAFVDATPETVTIKDGTKYVLDRMGADWTPEQRKDYLNRSLTASRVLNAFVTRAVESNFFGAASDPWYARYLASPIMKSGLYVLGQKDPVIREWTTGFAGAVADDTSQALLLLALGKKPAEFALKKLGWQGAPAVPILDPLSRVSAFEQVLGGPTQIGAILRSRMVAHIGEALNNLADPAQARAIMERAITEARLRGGADASFTASVTQALDELSRSEAQFGLKKLSPSARAAVIALGPRIADLGPTQAWYTLTGEGARFHPIESARYTADVLKLFNAIEEGKPLTLEGSAATFLQRWNPARLVGTLLNIRNRRQEVLARRESGLQLVSSVQENLLRESELLKDQSGTAKATRQTLIEGQQMEVAEALGRLIEQDTKGRVRYTAHPDLGGPLHERIEKLSAIGTLEAWHRLASDRTTIEAIGGPSLWQEVQSVLNPSKKGGKEGLIGVGHQQIDFLRGEIKTMEAQLARPDLDPVARKVFERQLAKHRAKVQAQETAAPPSPVALSDEAAVAAQATGATAGQAAFLKEQVLRLMEEVPELIVRGSTSFDELVQKYTAQFENGVRWFGTGQGAVPLQLSQTALDYFSRATEAAFAAAPEAAYVAFARRAAGYLISKSAGDWLNRVLQPIPEHVPPRPAGARPSLYGTIADKIASAKQDGKHVSLSKAELAALNEAREASLSYEKLPAKVKALAQDAQKADDRLAFIQERLPELEQLARDLDAWGPRKAADEPAWKATSGRAGIEVPPPSPEIPVAPAEAPITLIPFDVNLIKIPKKLARFLEQHLQSPEWALMEKSFSHPFETPLTFDDLQGTSGYRTYQVLKSKMRSDVDVLTRGDALAKHLRGQGFSEAEIDRGLFEHGLQKVGALDLSLLSAMARRSKRWKAAYMYALNSERMTAQNVLNAARYDALKLVKWLGRTLPPVELQDIIVQMKKGEYRHPIAQAAIQRFLYDQLAEAYKSGRISVEDFFYYVGKDGYYHGVFEGKNYHELTGASARLPIPRRFRDLEVHPYEFSAKIPEEGYWIAYRTKPKAPLQYVNGPAPGQLFETAEAAAAWLDANPALKSGIEVSVNSPWKFASKEAAGLIVDVNKSLPDLAVRMALNNAGARLSRIISRAPDFARTYDEARPHLLHPEDTTFFDKQTGDRWVKVTSPWIPALRDHFVHEHVVQWLNAHNQNLGWIRAMTQDLQNSTGLYNMGQLADVGISMKNPLLSWMHKAGERYIGSYIPKVVSSVALTSLGHLLALSKVLLSLPSYMKQFTSNWLYNMPAMGFNPLAPSNWGDMLRYSAEGAHSYPIFIPTEGRLTARLSDWAWQALYRNNNIEITASSFNRQVEKIFKDSWESQSGLHARLTRARENLAAETISKTPDDALVGQLSVQIADLENKLREIQTAPGGAFHQLGSLFTAGMQDLWKFFSTGEGALNDFFFNLFGFADQISKYVALRHLVETQGMTVEAALGRIDKFGQNLHRAPDWVKSLSNRLGGTKFTTYPFNQAETLINTFKYQAPWLMKQAVGLYAFNAAMRAGKGENSDEMKEVFARTHGYGTASLPTDLLFNLGRVELPSGGYIDMEPVLGIFMPQSPFARGMSNLILKTKVSETSGVDAAAKIASQGAASLFSRFAGGSAIFNLFGYIMSGKGPRGAPIQDIGDFLGAFFSTFTPEVLPPYGRDYEFLWKGPALDPLTNKPRPTSDYILRRFFNWHSSETFDSWARMKAAMDATLEKDGALGRFYGELAYYDLLEVKARAAGALTNTGEFDMTRLDQVVREHLASEGITRAFPGMGADEIPDPKSRLAVANILRTITEPRMARTFNHLNFAQQLDTYMLWRSFDRAPDAAVRSKFESLIGRKLIYRTPDDDMLRRAKDVWDYWQGRAEQLPDDALRQLGSWMSAAVSNK